MSPALTDYAAVALLALACWGLRITCILLVSADRFPRSVSRALELLAPAALASICAVEVSQAVHGDSHVGAAGGLAVVAVAALLATRLHNAAWPVLAGLAGVLLLDLVLLG
jgi:branched-subunit amino acid transport protein